MLCLMILNNYRSKKLLQNKDINRFREIFGIKQEALAIKLDILYAAVSKLDANVIMTNISVLKLQFY